MPGTVMTDFVGFKVTIADKATTGAEPTITMTFSGSTSTPTSTPPNEPLASLGTHVFELTINKTYAIDVVAYLDITGGIASADPSATGNNGTTGTTIVSGTNPSVNIALYGITASGNGTLSWNLTYDGDDDFTASDLTVATLSYAPLSDVTDTTLISDLLDAAGNSASSAAIPSGYHYVILRLEKEDFVPVIYTEIVHINKGMTSSGPSLGTTATAKDFDELVALPKYAVTFNDYDVSGTDGLSINYTHAQAIKDNTTYATTNSLPVTETGGFLGWYTAVGGAGGTGTKVELTDRIYSIRTLFGSWYSTPELKLSVTIDQNDEAIGLAFVSGFTDISKANLYTTGGVVLEADLSVVAAKAGLTDVTFVKWVVAGQTVSTTNPSTGGLKYGIHVDIDTALGATSNTVPITLHITAEKGGTTRAYSETIWVDIVN
jgi:hypothetical protein